MAEQLSLWNDRPPIPSESPYQKPPRTPLTLRELPESERPLNRLHQFGPAALSTTELLAISRAGRTIVQGGFTSHSQAGARMEGEYVVFLLLQRRQLDVRAQSPLSRGQAAPLPPAARRGRVPYY